MGITRNIAGNMAHVTNRIAAYKKALFSVISAGIARNSNANTAAAMRVHQLYAVPVLFSGLACLCLSKKEVKMIEVAHLKIVQNLLKLNDKTPRSFTYFVGGSLPAEAILHQRQLSLFLMVCHLVGNPIKEHAINVLSNHKITKRPWSWFQQIRDLCLRYGLQHPLQYLACPPEKSAFKSLVKKCIITKWQNILRSEAAELNSLCFFTPSLYTLNFVHPAITAAGNNPYECRKTDVMLRMQSGRYRSEHLTRHWMNNRGFCSLYPCRDMEVIGDLEHLLLNCPATETKREILYNFLSQKSEACASIARNLTNFDSNKKMKFLLEPLSLRDVAEMCGADSGILNHILYFCRTFVYTMHLAKLEATKMN